MEQATLHNLIKANRGRLCKGEQNNNYEEETEGNSDGIIFYVCRFMQSKRCRS